MKTSKEMQLRILDKMRENVESGSDLYVGIEIFTPNNSWYGIDEINYKTFKDYDVRIKPETITINGVEIPKPLNDCELKDIAIYAYISCNGRLFSLDDGRAIKRNGIRFVYNTSEEAIEASKLLFGIKD